MCVPTGTLVHNRATTGHHNIFTAEDGHLAVRKPQLARTGIATSWCIAHMSDMVRANVVQRPYKLKFASSATAWDFVKTLREFPLVSSPDVCIPAFSLFNYNIR